MLTPMAKYIDLQYSLDIIDKLISFESNKDLGFRTAGSAAELEAAEFLYNEYKKIGLSNVRKEKVTVDTFEFINADLSYKDSNGETRNVIMSSFQTNCQAKDEEIEIIYVNKGRDIDYEGLDVEGKYVLIDINMMEDWWINWPLCQGRVKGVKGMIFVNIDGYCAYSEEALGIQDVSAPADTPTFCMSVKDSRTLKESIKAAGGSIKACLNADVRVGKDGFCYDVIGEIPGEIDEVIYLIGHYDAYFRAYSDNTSGIACMLGITKALIESGYKPKRTLRVICHGAEEWGIENTRYDWARGATMLTNKHPEWMENGFLLLNLDGNLISSTAEAVKIRTPYEMVKGVEEIASRIDGSMYKVMTNSPLWTWTESYMYDMLGIPTIESFYEGFYFWDSYHSTMDNREANAYSDEAYLSSHILYGSFLQEFDKLDVRPLDFCDLFSKLEGSVDTKLIEDADALYTAIAKASYAATKLKEKEQSGITGKDLLEYNKKVSKIFKKVTDDLFGLDWYETYDFIHMRNCNNINALNATIEALEKGDLDAAIDEHLKGVDLAWQGYNFDKPTYDFIIGQVLGENAVETWAKGKVNTHADLWQLSRDLIAARTDGNKNVGPQIEGLKKELALQKSELKSKVQKEIAILFDLTAMMQEAAK